LQHINNRYLAKLLDKRSQSGPAETAISEFINNIKSSEPRVKHSNDFDLESLFTIKEKSSCVSPASA
jgi:hypothetical protein